MKKILLMIILLFLNGEIICASKSNSSLSSSNSSSSSNISSSSCTSNSISSGTIYPFRSEKEKKEYENYVKRCRNDKKMISILKSVPELSNFPQGVPEMFLEYSNCVSPEEWQENGKKLYIISQKLPSSDKDLMEQEDAIVKEAKELLKLGANINYGEYLPLYHALEYCHFQLAELLLSQLDIRIDFFMISFSMCPSCKLRHLRHADTPLTYINRCIVKYLKYIPTKKRIIELLLEKGADINQESNDDFRMTSLQYAKDINDQEIVKLLIEKGAEE